MAGSVPEPAVGGAIAGPRATRVGDTAATSAASPRMRANSRIARRKCTRPMVGPPREPRVWTKDLLRIPTLGSISVPNKSQGRGAKANPPRGGDAKLRGSRGEAHPAGVGRAATNEGAAEVSGQTTGSKEE